MRFADSRTREKSSRRSEAYSPPRGGVHGALASLGTGFYPPFGRNLLA